MQDDEKAIKDAVTKAQEEWGQRQLDPLEAEDRLSVACEKAPVSAPALQALRGAFEQLLARYEPECARQKEEIVELGGLQVCCFWAYLPAIRAGTSAFCCATAHFLVGSKGGKLCIRLFDNNYSTAAARCRQARTHAIESWSCHTVRARMQVVGTARHEARRIDNQLRGRCGRQGDPGSTRFFLSLQVRDLHLQSFSVTKGCTQARVVCCRACQLLVLAACNTCPSM